MKTTVDRSTLTITFQRLFEAPVADVFDAWTQPEQITHWWDPTGTPLARCTVDLRPGGAFSFEHASGHAPPFAGTYTRIDRPGQLAFDAMGAAGTVRLSAEGRSTRMIVTIRCPSAAHLDTFLKLGVDTGTDQTLDNLVARLSRRKAG